MSKIKICGLSRIEDIDYVNEAMPEYAGFIIHFPKSHRNVERETLKLLKRHLDNRIKAVGVFVNQPIEFIFRIVQDGLIDIVQLHGNEDETYIRELRDRVSVPIIKAFQIKSREEIELAEKSTADFILLDAGQGNGKTFDWNLLANIKRPYFLAGGISEENVQEAVNGLHPFALDVSSGVETRKRKDKRKICKLIQMIRTQEEMK